MRVQFKDSIGGMNFNYGRGGIYSLPKSEAEYYIRIGMAIEKPTIDEQKRPLKNKIKDKSKELIEKNKEIKRLKEQVKELEAEKEAKKEAEKEAEKEAKKEAEKEAEKEVKKVHTRPVNKKK